MILGASHLVALHVRGWAHFSEGPDAIGIAFAQARIADKLTNPVPVETADWTDGPSSRSALRQSPHLAGTTRLENGSDRDPRVARVLHPTLTLAAHVPASPLIERS